MSSVSQCCRRTAEQGGAEGASPPGCCQKGQQPQGDCMGGVSMTHPPTQLHIYNTKTNDHPRGGSLLKARNTESKESPHRSGLVWAGRFFPKNCPRRPDFDRNPGNCHFGPPEARFRASASHRKLRTHTPGPRARGQQARKATVARRSAAKSLGRLGEPEGEASRKTGRRRRLAGRGTGGSAALRHVSSNVHAS